MKITIENSLKSGVIVKTRVISIVSNPIKVVVVVIVIVVVVFVKKKNVGPKICDPTHLGIKFFGHGFFDKNNNNNNNHTHNFNGF